MSVKIKGFLLFLLLSSFGFQIIIHSQIDDIKNKSKENKENKKNTDVEPNSNNNENNNIGESILSGCFSGCFDVGCMFFTAAIVDYTKNVYKFRQVDPSIFSVDIDANVAPAYHFSSAQGYNYLIFLPRIRANLVSFMLDFRFNLLTEFTDDVPNSFKSWDLVLAFNIVPSEKFLLSLGMGVQREMNDVYYYHEYYVGSKIGLLKNRDYLFLDFRCSADYETNILPFQEAGINYNLRIIDFENLSAFCTFGGIYQNYYQSHDIWAIKAGLIFNLH